MEGQKQTTKGFKGRTGDGSGGVGAKSWAPKGSGGADKKKAWGRDKPAGGKPGGKPGDKKPYSSAGKKPYSKDGEKKPWQGKNGAKKPWQGKAGAAAGGKKPWEKGSSSSGDKRKRDDAGSASADTSSKDKRQLKKERQALRPDNEVVVRAKEIWNKLRDRSVPAPQRASLVHELVSLLEGKVYKISMKHDASRVVQAAIMYGTPADKASILSELEGHLVELSQLQYAHFIVLKLLQHARAPAERRKVLKDLRGSVAKLATHSIGARVVQQALDTLPSASAALIKAELYGPEHALFADAVEQQPRNLKAVITLRPDRTPVVLEGISN
jgi:pumilio homology domain family member 6